MATLLGLPLYERFGFEVISQGPIRLPDGILLECAAMESRSNRRRMGRLVDCPVHD